ncbi:50S ribosomal protein L10 [Anaerorhabdus sp.]|uniref:50S ribosomal protein L10 n=1 Tax=Anaerorhabdus sp. TaxID=1872524 RepID=UPI002FC6CF9E
MRQTVLDAKQAVVTEIQDKFAKSASSVVVEYRGLSVAEVTELRRELRKENVEFKIYKNTMSSRAAEAAGFNDLSQYLTGPNAIAFSDDAVAPSRILAKFAKKHEALVLKSGIVEGKVVDVNTIKELSNLPNRDGMLSMLLGCLQSPVRSFACVVKAVADAKEANGGAAPVVEAAKEETVEAAAPAVETVETPAVEEAAPVAAAE